MAITMSMSVRKSGLTPMYEPHRVDASIKATANVHVIALTGASRASTAGRPSTPAIVTLTACDTTSVPRLERRELPRIASLPAMPSPYV